MEKGIVLLKRAWMALLFFFLSCSTNCPQWEYQEVKTHCQYYDSKKIILRPQNRFRGLELAFVRTHTGRRAYLNIFSLSFPKEKEDPSKTKITITSCESAHTFLAERFEGGQRLLLSQEAGDLIISNLVAGNTVTISVGRYQSDIAPNGFCRAHRQLMSCR